MEPCRGDREPVRHRVPARPYPGGIAHHDLRDSDRRALGRQRGALCRFARPVFPGANGMGAGGSWDGSMRQDLRSSALLASSYGIVVALVLEKWAPKNAFVSILGAALVGMLLAWLVSLAAHISSARQSPPANWPRCPCAPRSGPGARRWASCSSSWHFSRPAGTLTDADQRRVHDRADRGLFPAEKK